MILVVGAGAAGLATAYHLQQRGLPYQVLERQEPGYSWANHYDRLRLHTLKQVSHLPGRPMPAAYPDFPGAWQVRAYLQDYADHFQLNIQCGVDVQQATWDGQQWSLETNQGRYQGALLMAATGIWSTPFQPVLGGEEQFGGTIMHSYRYRNPEPFSGQRVLVVGAGNSGTEIAVDLCEAGTETGIAIRGGVVFVRYPRSADLMRWTERVMRDMPRPIGGALMAMAYRDFSHLGLPLPPPGKLMDTYPVVGFELPEAVEAGKVTVYPALERFLPGGVQFADGQQAAFDAVIMATGFRPSLQFVAHEVNRRPDGHLCLDRFSRSNKNKRLFCIGFTYPPTAGWLQVIGRVTHDAVSVV
jgi:hypothetical protein